jgi:hypothetical protein
MSNFFYTIEKKKLKKKINIYSSIVLSLTKSGTTSSNSLSSINKTITESFFFGFIRHLLFFSKKKNNIYKKKTVWLVQKNDQNPNLDPGQNLDLQQENL